MFKIFNKKRELVFSSDSLEEVEQKALEYKKQNNLSSIDIRKSNGAFYKWM